MSQSSSSVHDDWTRAFHERLDVDGTTRYLRVDACETLLDALDENDLLASEVQRCPDGGCGKCRMHVDGRAVLACMTVASLVGGASIRTGRAQPAPSRSSSSDTCVGSSTSNDEAANAG